MDSTTEARLGLALSGGGHRAAFFHIGVLAKLAELGLLRSIEVISTVSGGSIVGALYYLHIKNLLEDKPDGEITDLDYVEVVREVESDYRQAAATNIRGSGWANPAANFHMAIPTYSRTDRAGELYEQRFYARAWRDRPRRKGRIAMRDLKIHPAGSPDGFSPVSGNAGRSAKVPVLLLEATTLNTGHNWRFEAGYLGESPRQHCRTGDLREDVDKNTILERTAWDDDALPESCKDFPLGSGVVSSACFPGGFPPMQIPDIFTAPPDAPRREHRDDMIVRLVDGGVHDNQGIEGLRDRGCTHFIVSDGSGQMPDKLKPSMRLPAVLGRIVSIYGDAEREERLLAVLDDPDTPAIRARLEPILAANGDAELADKVMAALEKPETTAFMHLQTGLQARERRPREKTTYEDPKLETAEFGVDLDVQRALAKIRTDLDAFCDLEAWALMADGYQLAGRVVPRRQAVAELGQPVGDVGWAFTPVIAMLAAPDPRFLKVLEVGKERFLRPARMTRYGFRLANVALGLFAAAAVAGLWLWLTPHGTALFIAGLATVLTLGLYFSSDAPYVKPVATVVFDIIVPALLALPLVAVAWVQIAAGKRWLKVGRLEPDAEAMPAGAAVGQP